MGQYAKGLVAELIQPLHASINGRNGPEVAATIILCETLLSLLPSMTVKDLPYNLLKGYEIMPMHSATMALRNRLTLFRFAAIRGGMLNVTVPQLEGLYLPLAAFSCEARSQIIPMVQFVNACKSSDRNVLAAKAAKVLTEEFFAMLVHEHIIGRPAEVKSCLNLWRQGTHWTATSAQKRISAKCLCQISLTRQIDSEVSLRQR